ncbi:hypothetical protein [Flavihumibacter petaseus]|nr:hypothetical protein [Flavihumibacter petaseus]
MLSISPWLAEKGRQSMPYGIPGGYFEGFPDKMLVLARSASELGDYTDNQDIVIDPIDSRSETEGLSTLLAGISRKAPFNAPEGYFEQLAIPENVGDPEISPVLTRLNPYAVPERYFDAFPERMLAAVTPSRKLPARVFPMGRNILRYAAAAAITGIIALGGWYYQSKNGSINGADAGSQESVTLQLEKELNQLSDDAFADYSFLPPAGEMPPAALANNDDDLNANDIHFLLEDISDKSLQEFLADQPGKMASPSNN